MRLLRLLALVVLVRVLTPGGWFVMLFSVGTVTGVFLCCLWKVLRTPDETEKLHGFSFETPDEKSDP